MAKPQTQGYPRTLRAPLQRTSSTSQPQASWDSWNSGPHPWHGCSGPASSLRLLMAVMELPQPGPSLTSKLLGWIVQVTSSRLHHAPIIHQPAQGQKSGSRVSATTRRQRGPSERSGLTTNHSTARADAPPSPGPKRQHQKLCLLFPTRLHSVFNITTLSSWSKQPLLPACSEHIGPCSPPLPISFTCIFHLGPLGQTAADTNRQRRNTMLHVSHAPGAFAQRPVREALTPASCRSEFCLAQLPTEPDPPPGTVHWLWCYFTVNLAKM